MIERLEEKTQNVLNKFSASQMTLQKKGARYALKSEEDKSKLNDKILAMRESRSSIFFEKKKLRAESCLENRTISEIQRKVDIIRILRKSSLDSS